MPVIAGLLVGRARLLPLADLRLDHPVADGHAHGVHRGPRRHREDVDRLEHAVAVVAVDLRDVDLGDCRGDVDVHEGVLERQLIRARIVAEHEEVGRQGLVVPAAGDAAERRREELRALRRGDGRARSGDLRPRDLAIVVRLREGARSVARQEPDEESAEADEGNGNAPHADTCLSAWCDPRRLAPRPGVTAFARAATGSHGDRQRGSREVPRKVSFGSTRGGSRTSACPS